MKAHTKKSLLSLFLTVLILAAMTAGTLAADTSTELETQETASLKPIPLAGKDVLTGVKDADKIDGIVIQGIPDASAGTLMVGNRKVLRGEGIAVESLDTLNFVPATKGTIKTTFSFIPVYKDGTAGAPVTYELNVTARRNNKPVAENLQLYTYRNIAVGGVFHATDADGDTLTYQLTSTPKLGVVKFDAEDSAGFLYEPYQNKGGTDTFTYVAFDEDGAVSEACRVTVKIEKPSTKITYSDMSGNKAYYPALRLAEEGVFVGKKVADSYYLEPEELVTRGEFIAMAVALTGIEQQPASIRTSFADDAQIPVWVKPFAVAAVKAGFIQGSSVNEERVLLANDLITRAEAAVILNNAAETADVATMKDYADEEAIPTWAKQAAVNMETLGIMPASEDGRMNLDCAVTRADAMELLYNLMAFRESTTEKAGLFSWIK